MDQFVIVKLREARSPRPRTHEIGSRKRHVNIDRLEVCQTASLQRNVVESSALRCDSTFGHLKKVNMARIRN